MTLKEAVREVEASPAEALTAEFGVFCLIALFVLVVF
jgi:hypothetical protein